jgi:hypothetical protein
MLKAVMRMLPIVLGIFCLELACGDDERDGFGGSTGGVGGAGSTS